MLIKKCGEYEGITVVDRVASDDDDDCVRMIVLSVCMVIQYDVKLEYKCGILKNSFTPVSGIEG